MQETNDQNLINYYESQKTFFESKATKLTNANTELQTDIQDLLAENQSAASIIKKLEIENSQLKETKIAQKMTNETLKTKNDSQYKELDQMVTFFSSTNLPTFFWIGSLGFPLQICHIFFGLAAWDSPCKFPNFSIGAKIATQGFCGNFSIVAKICAPRILRQLFHKENRNPANSAPTFLLQIP